MNDICIVGGGVIGLAAAYELAGRGREVTVLEAATIGARAAAGVAGGMLAPYAEADVASEALTRLAVASHARYPEFVARLEADTGVATSFDRVGTLVVAAHRDHRAPLLQLEAFQRDRGLQARRLSSEEVRHLEPALGPAVGGGLLLDSDWQVDPRCLLRALVAGVAHHGGRVHEQASVEKVRPLDRCWEVVYWQEGERQELHARQVLLAAGAWTADLSQESAHLPLRPVRGDVLRLGGERLLRHVVRTPVTYLVPRPDGELVVGATSEERGFDLGIRAGAIYELLREAQRVVPGIDELELDECGTGFRPALRDHIPAIGELAPGLFIATGHYRNGVELAPITAELLADLICEGKGPEMLAELSPTRFDH